MTHIVFYKNINGNIVKIEASGHTNYKELGSDTLCAAVSAIIQAGALGLINHLKIKANIVRNDDKGYFSVELPKRLSSESLKNSQIVFNTMLEGLSDLAFGYSKYINLEVK